MARPYIPPYIRPHKPTSIHTKNTIFQIFRFSDFWILGFSDFTGPYWTLLEAILDLFGIDFHSDFEKVHVRSLEITWGHLGNGRKVSSSKVQILAIYRVNVKRFNVKIAIVKIANLTSNDMKWPQMTSRDRFQNQSENPFQISPKSLIFIL